MHSTMLDSKPLNTSLLEVLITFRNDHVLFCDWCDLMFQIVFNDSWASFNVGSKYPIAWNDFRHVSSRRFKLECGHDETGNPGIICMFVIKLFAFHQNMGLAQHFLAQAHIAKLNELTESEVTKLTRSTLNGTALAILQRQGSRGITIASQQRKFIINVEVNPY
jgi:hypothetical protein